MHPAELGVWLPDPDASGTEEPACQIPQLPSDVDPQELKHDHKGGGRESY